MPEQPDAPGPLSPWDVEILRLVALGYSFHDISIRLALSRGISYRRIQRLMTLLDARDRAELEAKAREMGLG